MKQRPCLCFSTSTFDLDTKMLKCPLQMVPNRFFSHDGPVVASAENPGVHRLHPIDRFFSLIESIPIIRSKEVGRGIKTCPVRTEKNAFFFQKAAEQIRRMSRGLDKFDLNTPAEIEGRTFFNR